MTFLITDDVSQYKQCSSRDEVQLLAAVNNEQYVSASVQDIAEHPLLAKIKVVTEFKRKLVMFDVIAKNPDNSLTVHCQNFPLSTKFDKNTNRWSDCSLRKLLNSKKFISKFESEFVAHVQTAEVHTESYITKDKFWLLSHEEIGQNVSWLKQNINVRSFPLFKFCRGNQWWLRSSRSDYCCIVGCVLDYGNVNGNDCSDSLGVAPACVIA